MKKNRFVKIISAVTVFTGLLFTSCHDNIYALIEKEVELDTSGLKGDISNIVRCNDYLFLANGNIYGKKAVTLAELGTHNWSGVNSPVSGKSEFNVSNRVVWLAADDTYLYALALFHDEDDNGANYDDARAIYAAKVEDDFITLEWEKVIEASDDKIKIIFDNKANSGRNAYANIGGKVYKLSGTSKPAQSIMEAIIFLTITLLLQMTSTFIMHLQVQRVQQIRLILTAEFIVRMVLLKKLVLAAHQAVFFVLH